MRRGWKRNPRLKVDFERVLKQLPKAAEQGAHDALAISGDEAVRIIRADTPVGRRGLVRRSVRWNFGDPIDGKLRIRRRTKIPKHLRISIYAGGKIAPHAHLLHNGTAERKQNTTGRRTGRIARAKPFFWPNIRALRRRQRSRIARAAGKAIRQSAKRGRR